MGHSGEPGQDERLYEALAEYLEAAERGRAPDPAEVITRHPEFAPELRDFLETRLWLRRLTAPVRWAVRSARLGPGAL